MTMRASEIIIKPRRLCARCGHDVTVQLAYGTLTCPECGEPIGWRSTVGEDVADEAAVRKRRRDRWIIAVAAWVLVTIGVGALVLL